MAVYSSHPLLWTTFGSLAILALSSITATASTEQCPPPVTVTKTEISTVWADGSWPTKTVTQTIEPNDCPSSPRYSCYVVQTTTVAAQIPQATIHMVLPPAQDSRQVEVKDNLDALRLEAEGLDEAIRKMEWMGFEAEEFVVEGGEPSHPEAIVITDPAPIHLPTPTRPNPGLPLPACVNYKTETMTGPCPTVASLPLDKEGCAIIMSTSLVMTTATAVPENNPFGKEDIEQTYTYTYTPHEELGDDETSKKRKHHHKHHLATTTSAAVAVPSAPTTTVAPPAAHDVVVSPPFEVTKTFESSYSTHMAYTLSFDFTYGTPSASPIRTPTPVLPELPPPPPRTSPTSTAEPPTAAPASAPEPKIAPTSSESVPPPPPSATSTPEDTAPTPTSVPEDPPASIAPVDMGIDYELTPSDLTGNGSEDDPHNEANETGDMSDPPLAEESLPEDPSVTPVVEDPPSLGPPTSTAQKTKACQTCAEPCLVELNIAAKAEASLLQKLFETQIQKAIASLKITLQNEISLSSSTPTKTTPMSPSSAENGQAMGQFGKLTMDSQTSDLLMKTVEDRCTRLEAEYRQKLPSRCEKVVHQDCVTGDCVQREVDKAVQLLDVMLSAELTKDASHLRTEILSDFKKKCEDHNDKVEKRGLVGGLLGKKLGGALDKTVDSLAGVVDKAVVRPLTGQSLVQPLVDGLSDYVKTMVDSFVRNCNRKDLLDFDRKKEWARWRPLQACRWICSRLCVSRPMSMSKPTFEMNELV